MQPHGGQGPGKARLFVGYEVMKAYPELLNILWPGSFTLELTNYDIGSPELKAEHKNAIWDLCLKASGKEIGNVIVWGFHSHTGDPGFNAALAERRAEIAMRFASFTGVIDTTIKTWNYHGVPWHRGMKEGEDGGAQVDHNVVPRTAPQDPAT